MDEALEAFQGAGGGGGIDGAGPVEPLAEARNLPHAVGGAEALALIDVGDEESDRVGADIDGTDPYCGLRGR